MTKVDEISDPNGHYMVSYCPIAICGPRICKILDPSCLTKKLIIMTLFSGDRSKSTQPRALLRLVLESGLLLAEVWVIA